MGEAEDRWRDEEEERQLDWEERHWVGEITGEVLTHSSASWLGGRLGGSCLLLALWGGRKLPIAGGKCTRASPSDSWKVFSSISSFTHSGVSSMTSLTLQIMVVEVDKVPSLLGNRQWTKNYNVTWIMGKRNPKCGENTEARINSVCRSCKRLLRNWYLSSWRRNKSSMGKIMREAILWRKWSRKKSQKVWRARDRYGRTNSLVPLWLKYTEREWLETGWK